IGSENRFLDGRTADPVIQVGLAPSDVEPFTGTRWLVLSNPRVGRGAVSLVCLGDIDGPRYLDGHTVDGTVGLAPNTSPPFTGTAWRVVDTGTEGIVNLFCLGDRSDGQNARFLSANTIRGTVSLAQDPGPATRWAIVDAQPDPVGGPGISSASSASSPSLLATPVDPFVYMAWRALDERVSIMMDVLGAPFTVSLAHRCIDRPALGIDNQTNRI